MLYLSSPYTVDGMRDHCRVYYGHYNRSNPHSTIDPATIGCDLEALMTADEHGRDEVMHSMGDVVGSVRAMRPARVLLQWRDLCIARVTVTALDLVKLDLTQYPSLVH